MAHDLSPQDSLIPSPPAERTVSRRALLTALAAVPLGGPALAALPGADPDALLLETWRRYRALLATVDGKGVDDDTWDRVLNQTHEMAWVIAQTPSQGLSGVLVKLRLLLSLYEERDGLSYLWEPDLLRSALATLKTLAENRVGGEALLEKFSP